MCVSQVSEHPMHCPICLLSCRAEPRFCDVKKSGFVRHLKGNDVLAREGERLSLVGIVQSGVLRVTQVSPDGKQQIVGLLRDSNMVGRPFSKVSTYGIEAATDVTLYAFDQDRFEELLSKHLWLERVFFRLALDQLDAARRWTALIGSHSAKERIASFFLMCALNEKNQAPHTTGGSAHRIRIPIDRRDMAAFLGTTPETISRFVRDLMRQGILVIKSSREFDILDFEAVRALAGNPSVSDRTPRADYKAKLGSGPGPFVRGSGTHHAEPRGSINVHSLTFVPAG